MCASGGSSRYAKDGIETEDVRRSTEQGHYDKSYDKTAPSNTLSDLIDITQVQNLAESLYKAAEMPIGIIDVESGEILVGAGWQDICVHFHRAHPESLKCCKESDRYIDNKITDGRPCAYKCKNGLWDIGIPILVEGQHMATLFLGQFLYEGESSDREFFIGQARRFSYDLSSYMDALDRIPVFSREKVNNILDYNVAFADFIADIATKKKSLKRELRERRRAEEAVLKANRVINALWECNNALIHIGDEFQLLQEICRIIVEVGDYRMAWVGYAENDADQTVTPVARYGYENGYLEKVCVTWADTERGQGPVGIAIRTGIQSVVRNVALEPSFAPWREEAIGRGYGSVIGLPLFVEDSVRGCLAIYAAEPNAFNTDEVNLLSKLQMNLSFGIAALRTSHARKQAEIALQNAHDELEIRVRERTAELAAVNEQLKLEIRERKRTEDVLRKSETQLRSLSSRLLTAHEEASKKLAGELHDSIGSSLTAIKFSLENTASPTDKGGIPWPDRLSRLIDITKQAIEESRRIMTSLRPLILDDLGIIPTLDWYCRQFESIYSGISIEKRIDIKEENVPEPLKIVIFRVIQEAFNNIAKYSKAELGYLSLRQRKDTIELIIEDKGVGFDMDFVRCDLDRNGGLGLASMRERTELSGGSFHLSSQSGRGTTIRASWPRTIDN